MGSSQQNKILFYFIICHIKILSAKFSLCIETKLRKRSTTMFYNINFYNDLTIIHFQSVTSHIFHIIETLYRIEIL